VIAKLLILVILFGNIVYYFSGIHDYSMFSFVDKAKKIYLYYGVFINYSDLDVAMFVNIIDAYKECL
jgi:hypothetical protein